MKRTLSIIAFISLITLLGGTVNAIPPENTPPQPTTVNETTEKIDLVLLVKAITGFLQSDRYLTESELKFKVGGQGVNADINLKTKTIVQSDQKFRSEIATVGTTGEIKPLTVIVSDGKQVWIHRPDLKQYAVTTYQKFDKSGDGIFMSISSSAFLNIPAKERKQIANSSLSDKNVLSYLVSAIDGVIKGNQATVDTDSFYVYHYKDAKEGFTFSAFVQPDNANLKQVQLVGKSEGLDIMLTEKILNRIANPNVTPQSFTFSPPRGTKKVKSLSITPF